MVKRGLAWTFQSFRPLKDRSIADNVALALISDEVASLSGLRGETRERARQVCERVGLGDRLEQHPGELPHAGLLRLKFARALATDPDLLLVDGRFEASASGVDPESVHLLENGRFEREGDPETLRGDDYIREAYLGG